MLTFIFGIGVMFVPPIFIALTFAAWVSGKPYAEVYAQGWAEIMKVVSQVLYFLTPEGLEKVREFFQRMIF